MSIQEKTEFSAADVVPHSGKMVLLDRIVDYSDEQLVAAVSVRKGCMFEENGEVPAWVGIEYMAQTIAAYAGIKAKLLNQPVKVGFLLGARSYVSSAAGFKIGAELMISAKELIQGENGLAVFRCAIEAESVEVTADLNVFQPDDLQQFDREMSQ